MMEQDQGGIIWNLCLILSLFHLYFHAQQKINPARAMLFRKGCSCRSEFYSSVNGAGVFGVGNLLCIFGALGTQCCLILTLFRLYFHTQQIKILARAMLFRKRSFCRGEFCSSANGTRKFGAGNLLCIFGTFFNVAVRSWKLLIVINLMVPNCTSAVCTSSWWLLQRWKPRGSPILSEIPDQRGDLAKKTWLER